MDHSEAVAKKIAESYLLGELSPEQREAYEEHYFSCAECANDVMAGATLVANVKEVLRTEPPLVAVQEPAARSLRWFAWLRPAYAMAAMVVLFGVLLYENSVTIPKLKEQAKGNVPQSLSSLSLLSQGSRGAPQQVFSVGPDQPFLLHIDIPPSDNFASYTCDIQSQEGLPQFSVPVSAETANEAVAILVPGSRLRPGRYLLVVRGNPSASNARQAATEIAHYSFSLEYKN